MEAKKFVLRANGARGITCYLSRWPVLFWGKDEWRKGGETVKRILMVALVMVAMMVTTAIPAFAAPWDFSVSVPQEQTGGYVSGYLTVSDGCVDFFGALDVPGHTSDTSNEFQGPVCLF